MDHHAQPQTISDSQCSDEALEQADGDCEKDNQSALLSLSTDQPPLGRDADAGTTPTIK